MSSLRWLSVTDFQLGLWISTNSVGYINTAKSLKRAESNLLADEKSPQHWILVAIWIINLYSYIYCWPNTATYLWYEWWISWHHDSWIWVTMVWREVTVLTFVINFLAHLAHQLKNLKLHLIVNFYFLKLYWEKRLLVDVANPNFNLQKG